MIVAINTTAQQTGSFTDSRDGKTYKTVTIGKQTWMAQDLNYRASSGSWCYEGDDSGNCDKLDRRLYNWKAAMESCPVGWHLPSADEWTELINYLGGNDVAGGKLKAKKGWMDSNTSATNSSSFSALPGGYRNYGGVFGGASTEGYWWSSTERSSGAWSWSGAWYFGMRYDNNAVNKYGSNHQKAGFSVRCVKD
ncbi:MAG: fibrobacter succinogenes major paralogous domain-containing protein [Bacteroidota bacterium]